VKNLGYRLRKYSDVFKLVETSQVLNIIEYANPFQWEPFCALSTGGIQIQKAENDLTLGVF